MSNFDEVLKSCINIKNIERTPEDYIDEYLYYVRAQLRRILFNYPDPRGLQLFVSVTPGLSLMREKDGNIMKYAQGRVVAMVDAVMKSDKR